MTQQVAVKLPDGLVEQLDRLVQAGAFDSRSQAIRSGLEAIVAARRREEVDRSYRDAFARVPETAAEIADATRLASRRSTRNRGSAGGRTWGALVGRGAGRSAGATLDC